MKAKLRRTRFLSKNFSTVSTGFDCAAITSRKRIRNACKLSPGLCFASTTIDAWSWRAFTSRPNNQVKKVSSSEAGSLPAKILTHWNYYRAKCSVLLFVNPNNITRLLILKRKQTLHLEQTMQKNNWPCWEKYCEHLKCWVWGRSVGRYDLDGYWS